MSTSNSPRDDKVVGTLRVPSPEHSQAEIEAELRDHLATAADRLQQQGLAPAAAQQKAQENFGSLAAIARRCYWIKQGDLLMFRTAVIGLLSVLCIALGITAWAGWRGQSRLTAEVSALTEQLRLLAEQQKAAPAEPKPLEIAGHAYVGSPDKPAANVQITILDVKDATHVRSVETDREGNFNSGPLGGGDYALLAETGKKMRQERYPRLVQSAPIGVYPGVSVPKQDFNIGCEVGALAIETSRPLPKVDVDGRYTIDSRLMVRIYSSQNRSQPWITAMEPPAAWPVYPQQDVLQSGFQLSAVRGEKSGRGSSRRGDGQEFYDILQAADLERFGDTTMGLLAAQLPAGKVEVAAAILADIYPAGYVPQPVPEFDNRGTRVTDENRALFNAAQAWQAAGRNTLNAGKPISLQSRSSYYRNHFSIDSDNYYWLTKGLGHIWLTHLQGAEEEKKPRLPHLLSSGWLKLGPQSAISLPSNTLTRIRIAVPDDLESRIRELVDRVTDPKEFAPLTVEYLAGGGQPYDPSTSPFFREAKFTVVGTEPLVESVSGNGGSEAAK